MLYTLATVLLALLVSHGRAALPSAAWPDAVTDVKLAETRAVGCNSPTLSQDLDDQSKVLGYANSACTTPQREWMLYESQVLLADQLWCQCKTNYYDKIETLAGVGVWLDCVGPAYVLLFAAVDAQQALESASLSQLYTDCSTLSSTGAFPPVDPALDRAVQVVDVVLDWRGKLLNIMTGGLQKEVQGVILSTIIDGVHEATISKANDFIDSKITQGYVPPSSSGVLRRQSDNSTEGEYISELTGVQVTVRLELNAGYTMDDVQAGLQRILGAENFTDKMAQLNGNVTSMKFINEKGVTTATSSTATMSTTASTSAATITSTSSASRSHGEPSIISVVWSMALLLSLPLLGLSGFLYRLT